MKPWIYVLAIALFAVSPASAAAPAPAKSVAELDARLGAAFKDAHIPGASVALVQAGHVTFAKGYGYADLARHISATADTPFRAGSISKSFTSIGIMTLVERHKLSLDEKLTDFAPDVHFTNAWEQTNPVRLANLLEHTTGWPDISTRVLARDEKSWSVLQGVQFSSSEFVSRWAPGRFMVYDNAGPAVATLAMERASGKTFDQYMRDAVLRPMGMATADFDLPPDLAQRISRSYAPDGTITPYQYIVLKPAGSLNVSARELAQLVRFYLANGTVDNAHILSPQSIARIERSETNLASQNGFTYGYGLGNAIFPNTGISFRGHNGQIDSFTSVYGYNRRCDCGYVLMANGGTGVDFGTPAAQAVQDYLTRGLAAQPKPIVHLDQAALDRWTGFYRVNTPPNALLRPYVEILNTFRVTAQNGKITLSGLNGSHEYYPVSEHLFRRSEYENPTLAFVEDGGEAYKIGAFTGGAVREPAWLVAAEALVATTCLLGAIAGLLMLLPWLYFAARRRLADRGGLLMRIAPLLSTVALCTMMILPLMVVTGSNTSALHQLADVGPYSVTILAGSILFPMLALTGLVLAIRHANARAIVRAYVMINSAALLVAAAYLFSIGWIPMQPWNM
ncbi:MAG TPA: serine hydrolase domain-containing protein [Rhizomicrobium sp.]|jgi:CubicO group peptidase (beta-lactamase class C family)